MLSVNAIDHIVINVTDVEISAAWYGRMLGMERADQRSDSGSLRTSMMFGRNKINLRPVGTSQEEWFTAATPSIGSDDLCFLTEIHPDAVAAHFRANGVDILAGPVAKNGAAGPIRSVYVRDPDGNLIEISSYL